MPGLQPWIVGILTLHAVVLATVVLTRRIPNLQIALLLWICGMVFLAQYINPFGAQHWRALGFTQNYFDERGVFISAVYSAPLLLIAGGQMVRRPLLKNPCRLSSATSSL